MALVCDMVTSINQSACSIDQSACSNNQSNLRIEMSQFTRQQHLCHRPLNTVINNLSLLYRGFPNSLWNPCALVSNVCHLDLVSAAIVNREIGSGNEVPRDYQSVTRAEIERMCTGARYNWRFCKQWISICKATSKLETSYSVVQVRFC